MEDSDLLRFSSWEGSPKKSRAIINESIAQLELESGPSISNRLLHCSGHNSQPMEQNIVATGEDFGDVPRFLETFHGEANLFFGRVRGGLECESEIRLVCVGELTEFIHWIRVIYWALSTYVNEKSGMAEGQVFSVFIQVPLQEDLVIDIESAVVKKE